MAEQRTYQGHVYSRNAPGEPWVLAGPADAGQMGTVIADPYKGSAERRAEEDQDFQREQLRIQQQNAGIAAQNAAIAAERGARESKAAEERGGVETTESERTAAFLATRLAGGLRDLGAIGDIGAPSLLEAIAGGTMLGNYATPEGRQRTINAQNDIVDATLTLGTGAAYTKEQIDNYRRAYFPQGMSGANEGLASTLGLPIDIMTAGMNLVPQGINAIADTNIPTITNPFLGGEWWKDRMDGWAIHPQTSDPREQFTRRVGQSVGAAAVPVAGAATTPGRAIASLLSATGGGVGAATAQQVAPGNQAAEIAAELLGSGVSGAGMIGLARGNARKAAEAAVPTGAQLRQQASDLYDTAESRGIVAGPNVTTNLAGRVRHIAADEKLIWPNGTVDPNYPRAGAAMNMLNAHAGQQIDVRQIQNMRDTLTDAVQATSGKERRIAGKMLDAFDAETTPLAPELADARRSWSRHKASETIGRSIEKADIRTGQFSQSGVENALRTEFRGLDRKLVDDKISLSPSVEEAIMATSRGTPAGNAARWVGKFSPHSPFGATVSTVFPASVGALVGGPGGAGVAAALALSAGLTGRHMATRMTQRSAEIAELLARNGGALPPINVVDSEVQRLIAAQLAGQSSQYAGGP